MAGALCLAMAPGDGGAERILSALPTQAPDRKGQLSWRAAAIRLSCRGVKKSACAAERVTLWNMLHG